MNKQTSSFLSTIIEKMKQIKKTDWLALALAGAILLILALPEETAETSVGTGNGILVHNQNTIGESISGQYINQATNLSENRANEYVAELEKKLEEVLEEMEGVGKVKVMITISDYGESVVEKDVSERENSVTELENGHSTKTSVEQEFDEQTIHVEDDSGSYPYVEKEILPTIEGIVVVAQGGGNTMVVSNISKAAMALFPIEAHKIIVVKMSDKGD